MALTVLFLGPVQASDFKGASWPAGTVTRVLGHGPSGGIASSDFSALAAQYRGTDGRILPNVIASLKLPAENRVALVAFSAGHGMMAPMLASDGDLIDAAVSLDACFSSPGAVDKAGYVDFARRAAGGSRLFVLVGSAGQNAPPLPPSTTGWQCASINAADGAAKLGLTLSPEDALSGVPTPKQVLGAGDLVALDYSGIFNHAQVVPKLAAPILNTYLVPYLAGSSTAMSSRTTLGTVEKVVGIGALGAAAFFGGRYLWKRYA